MIIIFTVHKLLFSKTTDLYTLDTKIWKNILSSHESKNIWICRQLKYYQLRIRSEIGFSLEIILNAFKCLIVSHSTEILILAIVPLSFISVSIFCKRATLTYVYILLSPQEKEVHSSSWGDGCTRLEVHSSKRLNPLSVIILVCLGNT